MGTLLDYAMLCDFRCFIAWKAHISQKRFWEVHSLSVLIAGRSISRDFLGDQHAFRCFQLKICPTNAQNGCNIAQSMDLLNLSFIQFTRKSAFTRERMPDSVPPADLSGFPESQEMGRMEGTVEAGRMEGMERKEWKE